MDALLTESATRLADRLRRRELRARDLLEVHIAHIQRENPTLNAMVVDRFDLARAEADAADRRLAAGDFDPAREPLLGVPCSIKECFALTGMPQTSGLVARKGLRADSDAEAVRRVRAAGAIPMGVTNVSELCMWMESNNKVYGRSSNPYDPTRIVGGSSGGEGALIGAGGSPFGIGSDVGGSIRMPAFFNGVFGHKPTGGLVANAGQYPNSSGVGLRYVTTGPLTRRAEDLMPLLRILAAGRAPGDSADPGAGLGPGGEAALTLGDERSVDLRGLSVLDVEDNGITEVSSELRAAQRRAAEHLASRGARVRQTRIPGLKRSLELWGAMLSSAGGEPFRELLANGDKVSWARELLRFALSPRRSPYTLPAIVLALVERVPELATGRAERAIAAGLELQGELTRAIGDGIMLYPSYSEPAPRHNAPLWPPFNWVYTAVLNVMELPVTQVPLGLGGEGLPLGVQVAASHGGDHRTIAVALELERAFGGWVPPPRIAAR